MVWNNNKLTDNHIESFVKCLTLLGNSNNCNWDILYRNKLCDMSLADNLVPSEMGSKVWKVCRQKNKHVYTHRRTHTHSHPHPHPQIQLNCKLVYAKSSIMKIDLSLFLIEMQTDCLALPIAHTSHILLKYIHTHTRLLYI